MVKKLGHQKKKINRKTNKNKTLKSLTKKGPKTKTKRFSDPKIIRLNSSSGFNYYKKNKFTPRTGEKRMIVIDGGNVAQFNNPNGYSVEMIKTVLTYFQNGGFECKAVVSQSRLRQSETSNHYMMQQLQKAGHLIVTPAKILPNSSPASLCGRFVLQIALEFDAAIISNDRYNDLVRTSGIFKHVVDYQVLGYTFNAGTFQLANPNYGENFLNRRN